MDKKEFFKTLSDLTLKIQSNDVSDDEYENLSKHQRCLINSYYGFDDYKEGELYQIADEYRKLFKTLVYKNNKKYVFESESVKIDLYGLYEGVIILVEIEEEVKL